MSKPEASILLVEDETILQFVFEKQLGVLGYKVARIVDDGLVAVEAVLCQQYDLVFMDVRLPGLDGMSATERIRARENGVGKHTKIIGMTAFAERRRCLDSGMDDFLQKPVLLEQLSGVIEKWLSLGNEAVNPAVLVEKAEVSLEYFQKAATQLDAIQARILSLRKRVGLDLPSKE
jgi:CheY-like chemotaxis protein